MSTPADGTCETPSVRVVEVRSRTDRERFIALPERLYRGDPNWVPPLRLERRRFLNPRSNPFFEHADVRLFLAVDESGRPRGRIAGIVNSNHLAVHHDGVGFFGLFEAEDDPSVAHALLDAAADFVRSHGLTTLRGPANMSVNDETGLLMEGFDSPPTLMMPYNPPYYRSLLEGYGLTQVMRLFAYDFEAPDGPLPERLTQGMALAKRRYGYTIRPVDPSRLDEDMRKMHLVYSEAWENNWGAVPMTEREFAHLGEAFKQFGDPDFCLIAEVDGEPAGFSLTLPDLNQALIKVGGRLSPLGLLRFLWYKRRIDAARLLALGVRKQFRNMGIDICLCHDTVARGLEKGYRRMEVSWILETNTAMNRVLEKFGARVSKTYAVFDRPL